MNIFIEPDFLSFPEIAKRWRLAGDSYDLHRAVMKKILRPCVLIQVELMPLSVAENGALIWNEDGDHRAMGWRYPVHECQVQTAAFEATYQVVSDSAEPTAERRFWELIEPITLTDILCHGVVMYGDLLDAEHVLKPREPGTKEINSLLCLISTMLADAYCWDPRRPNGLAGDLSRASKEHGNYLSDGTALKYMRQAFDQFAPSYMLTNDLKAIGPAKPSTGDAGPRAAAPKATKSESQTGLVCP